MPAVSFHVPEAWLKWLKDLAKEHGGMGKLVVKALEELIARYKQPEFIAGRPPDGHHQPVSEPERTRRRRRVAAAAQECGRCCKLSAEAEKWWQKYLAHLIERARCEKGAIFSVVVSRDVRRLFDVDVCPHLTSYFVEQLKASGCVREVLARGKSAKRYGYRLVLDKHCVLSLEAKHL